LPPLAHGATPSRLRMLPIVWSLMLQPRLLETSVLRAGWVSWPYGDFLAPPGRPLWYRVAAVNGRDEGETGEPREPIILPHGCGR
jgi:hypothetical protein